MSKLDNGFVPIPQGIAVALSTTRLTAHESNIVWTILRRTWGWEDRRKLNPYQPTAPIALTFLELATGIERSQVCRILKKLKDRNIVGSNKREKGSGNRPNTLWINSNVSEWITDPKGGGI